MIHFITDNIVSCRQRGERYYWKADGGYACGECVQCRGELLGDREREGNGFNTDFVSINTFKHKPNQYILYILCFVGVL